MATTAKTSVRFTRRGRVVVVLAVLAAAFVIFSLGRWGADANASDAASNAAVGHTTRSVIIEAGQSLWDIARDVRPGHDPRDTIHVLEQLNPDLDGGLVFPGQEIVIPA
jgi:LysM domain